MKLVLGYEIKVAEAVLDVGVWGVFQLEGFFFLSRIFNNKYFCLMKNPGLFGFMIIFIIYP